MSSLKCFHLPDLDFLIFEICSEWSNRAGPAWTSPGPPRARRTRFFEKCSEWSEMARKLVFEKNLPGPTPGPPDPVFWKMFRMIWNGEKIGFWKWPRLDLPGPGPGPLWIWQNFGVKLQTAQKYCGLYGTRTLIKHSPTGRALCESTVLYSHHISLQYFRAVYS